MSNASQPTEQSIGVGVIGFGRRAQNVIKHTFDQDSRFRLIGISDPAQTSREAAREFEPEVEIFDGHQTLVEDPRVDWVFVGSMNSQHREHATAGLKAGKPVFCEKPLATTTEDCLALAQAWRESGVNFAIGFVLRYSAHYKKIRELLDRGAIGDLVSLEFNETLTAWHGGMMAADWRGKAANSGGQLLEKCCHDMDLVNWYVGGRPARVACFGGSDIFTADHADFYQRANAASEPDKPFYHSHSDPSQPADPFQAGTDIADNQVAIIEYDNGVRATFHTNMHTGLNERRMYFCGTQGTLRADLIEGTIEVRKVWPGSEREDYSPGKLGAHGGAEEALGAQIARAMTSATPPEAGLKDGLISAMTCFGIDQAMAEQRIVEMTHYWQQVDAALEEPRAPAP